MLNEATIERVCLARGKTNLCKSIDGLTVIVKESFDLDPFSPCLFVFCNMKKDKLKILHCSNNGFWLYYKRLEEGKFKWPDGCSPVPMKITYRQLRWLLDGLSLDQGEAHKEVKARTIL